MSGNDQAADVGRKFDVVLDGYGFMFDKRPEARAELTYTPTFLDRQNTSGAYGDNEQDFFLTVSQHDWSAGDGQRFFRADDSSTTSGYFHGSAVSIARPGQVSMDWITAALTPTANFLAAVGAPSSSKHYLSSSSNLWSNEFGTFTDLGAHGAGTPNRWGMCVDRKYVYIAGSTDIRSYDGASFATFSTDNNAGSLAFLNNALYSCDGSVLKTYDGSGTATTLFTWKDATNTAYATQNTKIVANGATLLIMFQNNGVCGELWQYDGDGTTKIAELPTGSFATDFITCQGVVYVMALVPDWDIDTVHTGVVPALFALVNGNMTEIWRSEQNSQSGAVDTTRSSCIGVAGGRPVFFELAASGGEKRIRQYNPTTGAVSTLETVSSLALNGPAQMSSSTYDVLLSCDNGATTKKAFQYPGSTISSAGYVMTSQFDFGNALTKQMRGVKVDFTGGTVDIAYQLDGVGGSYTTLQSSAVSGTEYLFGSSVTGRTVSIKLTFGLLGGTTFPVVKRIYVRAAPVLQSYRKATYILDLSGRNGKQHARCHDGSQLRRDGLEQLAILRGLLGTTFSITDAVGTFTGTIDTGAFKADVVRPEEFIAVVPVREV